AGAACASPSSSSVNSGQSKRKSTKTLPPAMPLRPLRPNRIYPATSGLDPASLGHEGPQPLQWMKREFDREFPSIPADVRQQGDEAHRRGGTRRLQLGRWE